MAVKIGSNSESLRAQRQLSQSTSALSKIYERLSSGQRINRASDDAAGLAVAASLNKDARVFTQAIRNINDGVSALSIAEQALRQFSDITIRQKELAEQSASGTLSASQRMAIDQEAQALTDEYNRIIETTKFNGVKLYSDSPINLSIQAGVGSSGQLGMALGSSLVTTVSGSEAGTAESNFSVESGVKESTTIDLNGGFRNEYFDLSFTPAVDGDASLYLSTSIVFGDADVGFKFNLDGQGAATSGAATDYEVSVSSGMDSSSLVNAVIAAYQGSEFTLSAIPVDGDTSSSYLRVEYNNYVDAASPTLTPGVDVFANVPRTSIGDGGYFEFTAAEPDGSNTNYYVYLGSTDPALPGTGISVDITGINNAVDLASVIASAISANTNGSVLAFANLSSNGFIQVDNNFAGAVTPLNLTLFPGAINYQDATGADGGINLLTSSLTSMSHGLVTGDRVRITDSASPPGGLALDTDYYAIRVDNDTFKLATSLANAQSNTSIAILDGGEGTQTFTLYQASGDSSSTIGSISAQAIDLTTASNARLALTTLSDRLNNIALELGMQGAFQSRLSSAERTLQAARQSYSAAYSRIIDVDIAQESAELVRNKIFQESAAAILSQANQQPALAIKLLS